MGACERMPEVLINFCFLTDSLGSKEKSAAAKIPKLLPEELKDLRKALQNLFGKDAVTSLDDFRYVALILDTMCQTWSQSITA